MLFQEVEILYSQCTGLIIQSFIKYSLKWYRCNSNHLSNDTSNRNPLMIQQKYYELTSIASNGYGYTTICKQIRRSVRKGIQLFIYPFTFVGKFCDCINDIKWSNLVALQTEFHMHTHNGPKCKEIATSHIKEIQYTIFSNVVAKEM